MHAATRIAKARRSPSSRRTTQAAATTQATPASNGRDEVERPLAAYAALMGLYTLAFVGPLAVAAKRDALPKRPTIRDLALLGVGTFKLSRLLTTDAVTGLIRAPFVRYEGMEGVTSPKESPRGTGLRQRTGQRPEVVNSGSPLRRRQSW